MFNNSSLTIAAAAQQDKYRSIYAPNDYWRKKPGQPIIWSAPLVCWRSWVNEDKARAAARSRALTESYEWLRVPANLDKAIAKYGKLAAVKNKAQADVYKKWLLGHRVFLSTWDKKTRDKQWEFLHMAAKHGVLGKVPSKEKHGLILN